MTFHLLSTGKPQVNHLRAPFNKTSDRPTSTHSEARMTDEPPGTHPGTLTDLQRARIDYARRDLEYARAEDLAQLPAAGLILIIERLRTRLDDTLSLVDEITNGSVDMQG